MEKWIERIKNTMLENLMKSEKITKLESLIIGFGSIFLFFGCGGGGGYGYLNQNPDFLACLVQLHCCQNMATLVKISGSEQNCCPLKTFFQGREQPKVTQGKIWTAWGMLHNFDVGFFPEFCNTLCLTFSKMSCAQKSVN